MKVFFIFSLASLAFARENDTSSLSRKEKRKSENTNEREPDNLVRINTWYGDNTFGKDEFCLSCYDKNGTLLQTLTDDGFSLLWWADGPSCKGRRGDICLNIPDIQEKANPGINVRCVRKSHEVVGSFDKLFNEIFPSLHYTQRGLREYQTNNTMSCETTDGKVLSTFSGDWMALSDWAQGPDCSDGPDRHCYYLEYIKKPVCIALNKAHHKNTWSCPSGPFREVHKDVEIECIEDHGRLGKNRKGGMKYTLVCKHKGVVLSTSKDNVGKLRKWVRGPLCQPVSDFSTTQSTTTIPTSLSSTACPELQAIQLETNNESALLKCIEDNGKQYTLGCYINNELVSTKTGTVEKLKKWASGKTCGQATCFCQEQFKALDKARCVGLNRWQCQKTIVTGSCSGLIVDIFQSVKTNKKKKRPETKKRHCEKLAQKTKCDPSGYIPSCDK